MQQQMQQQMQGRTANGAAGLNHGGHEMFDVHEVLTCTINVMNQLMMLRSFVRDNELMDMLDRQYGFTQTQYNVTVECFHTGQKPSQETSTYMIQDMRQPVYGIQPAQPRKPLRSMTEITDAGIASQMLGLVKAHAQVLTMAALEVTNPVVRRVLASQVQNYIEMAYDIFLYQNKHGYYQVPQLDTQAMQTMLSAYATADGSPQMPGPGSLPGQSLH